MAALAEEMQAVIGQTVTLAYVEQGSTEQEPARVTAQHGIGLHVVKLPQARKGFVLPPKCWVVERSFACAARLRRLTRDHEWLTTSLESTHLLVFACLILVKAKQGDLLSH